MSSTFTCIHTHSLTNILGRSGSKYSQEGWPRPDLTPLKIRMGGCLMSALGGGRTRVCWAGSGLDSGVFGSKGPGRDPGDASAAGLCRGPQSPGLGRNDTKVIHNFLSPPKGVRVLTRTECCVASHARMVVRPPVLSSELVSTTAEMEQGAAIDTELRGLQFGCSNPTSVTALVHAEEFFCFP